VLALAASCLLVSPVRWLILRWEIVDQPNARSSHEAPTPPAGGLAIVLGTVATIPWFVPLNAEVISTAWYRRGGHRREPQGRLLFPLIRGPPDGDDPRPS
jgi:UDP-N-acetylmuramyl pentapeptide phosphotransferase/UDP-N-acetylglucosamine-1-phosphate transferase